MPVNKAAYENLLVQLNARKISLVAVSKTKSIEEIWELYDLGQRDFGENYVQELIEKQRQLPADIRWHFIGHLQSRKVRQVASFIYLIQSVDSLKLLKEINKQSAKAGRTIACLLQVHIAQEDTKFGLDEDELNELLAYVSTNPHEFENVKIVGLMGMASFTSDLEKIRGEFRRLREDRERFQTNTFNLPVLSMGMSSDYAIAIEEGSNLIRIGSLLFGERE